MSDTPSDERLHEIRSAQLGDWYSEPWHEDYVVASGDEPAYNRVVCGETTLATLPDFAGPIALWICDAHQAVPELLAEVDRLREENARLHREAEETLAERDHLHEIADQLSLAIAPREEIGEHSSENDPWQNALDIAAARTA